MCGGTGAFVNYPSLDLSSGAKVAPALLTPFHSGPSLAARESANGDDDDDDV